ncbi:MAG: hypothetical protein WKG07_12970 [Hymenobacter sp.]
MEEWGSQDYARSSVQLTAYPIVKGEVCNGVGFKPYNRGNVAEDVTWPGNPSPIAEKRAAGFSADQIAEDYTKNFPGCA